MSGAGKCPKCVCLNPNGFGINQPKGWLPAAAILSAAQAGEARANVRLQQILVWGT